MTQATDTPGTLDQRILSQMVSRVLPRMMRDSKVRIWSRGMTPALPFEKTDHPPCCGENATLSTRRPWAWKVCIRL